MPSAEVNSVIIRPQPPRLRMKRRKTVSVTPAIGARTVAGRISTPPRETQAGTRASGGATRSAGLSKNLCTLEFYRTRRQTKRASGVRFDACGGHAYHFGQGVISNRNDRHHHLALSHYGVAWRWRYGPGL